MLKIDGVKPEFALETFDNFCVFRYLQFSVAVIIARVGMVGPQVVVVVVWKVVRTLPSPTTLACHHIKMT